MKIPKKNTATSEVDFGGYLYLLKTRFTLWSITISSFKQRDELRREWVEKQAAIKEEEISITYSYWDGSGHRKQVRMKKGHSIHLFLHRCLEQLRKEFTELKSATADQLMYIKEDLIIPHHYSFYDFIVTKARGKSGPLFCFDVHDDIRLRMDANVEKEESHAGKVCLRSWYERNKHIFPASRWEPYDPTKNWDQYTISDKMAAKITVK
ncbi:Protein FAM50 [Fasciolopsis buskii]|uniref:Protein FAM50 n=1 Tax=Fasciolopsis buskii TaxID=27845 RepID=A0A8E0S622_9TREM|nr:Protein FAM50 [Fasciolopsis buski]